MSIMATKFDAKLLEMHADTSSYSSTYVHSSWSVIFLGLTREAAAAVRSYATNRKARLVHTMYLHNCYF